MKLNLPARYEQSCTCFHSVAYFDPPFPPDFHFITGANGTGDLWEASRTPEKLQDLPKNATALRGRRGAVHVKQAQLEEIKGHKFVKKFFRRPIYCSLCHEFLW